MDESRSSSRLRVIVPLAVLLVGFGVAVSVFMNTRRAQQPTPSTAAGAQTPTNPAPANPATAVQTPAAQPSGGEAPTAAQPTPTPSGQPGVTTAGGAAGPSTAGQAPSAGATPGTPAAAPATPPGVVALTGLRARPVGDDPASRDFAPLGELVPASGARFQLRFSAVGAGVEALDLADYFQTIKRTEPVRLQETQTLSYTAADGSAATAVMTPLAASRVAINGVEIDVTGYSYPAGAAPVFTPVWRQTAPGTFEAAIVNDQDQPVLRLTRRYELQDGAFVFTIRQRAENLSGQPLTVRWDQFAAVDLPAEKIKYVGDKRRVRFGFQYRPEQQGADPTVLSHEFLWDRGTGQVLGERDKASGLYPAAHEVWPNRTSTSQGLRLVWAAMTNRYFAVAAFPLVEPSATDKAWTSVERVHRLLLNGADPASSPMALALTGAPAAVAPGGAADFSMRVFAGPMSRPVIRQDAAAGTMGLSGLVAYNLGGMCGPCTFEILTGALIGLLHVVHDYLVFDWALAIMVLVLIVRGILHPVTRWSQIRIQRFGKQMSDMAPKMKKVQEKYAGDRQKLQQETAQLWKEEGINPAGALGCLPMFLQTPVWIALFATLFFATELRHEAAFFGLFQALSGGRWTFLADLSAPDHFIPLGRDIHVPLISGFMGPIDGINILPVVLGVVFWIQQKYLTPPVAAMTPEQEMQQKIIKFMMVFMFPIMMYNAPSGLAVYFITNSVLGIIESKWIKAHIEKHKLLEVKKPGPGGKPGFMQRLQAMAQERERILQQRQAGGKGMPPSAKRRPPRG